MCTYKISGLVESLVFFSLFMAHGLGPPGTEKKRPEMVECA